MAAGLNEKQKDELATVCGVLKAAAAREADTLMKAGLMYSLQTIHRLTNPSLYDSLLNSGTKPEAGLGTAPVKSGPKKSSSETNAGRQSAPALLASSSVSTAETHYQSATVTVQEA